MAFVMPRKINTLAPEIALSPVRKFATTAWMMIRTAQQTVQTVTVPPRLPASAELRTPLVRTVVIAVLGVARTANVGSSVGKKVLN